MPRHIHINQSEFPYHVTVRCINKEWFLLPMPQVWDIFSEQLWFAKYAFNIKIHAFVLMGNHFHLIISTPEANLSYSMAYLLREVSRELSRYSGRINRSFADRFHRSIIKSYHHYQTVYKYVYRNPVEAKLCDYVEDYPFSTLNGLLGFQHLLIPIENDTQLFASNDINECLDWLNFAPLKENREAVRLALKKAEFKLPKQRKKNLPHPLESLHY